MRNYEAIEYIVGKLKDGTYCYEDGKIINVGTGKEMKGSLWGKGRYRGFDLVSKGARYRAFIHTVVFSFFYGIEELRKHETLDHLNGNKYDNRIENLEGCTVLENNKRWQDRYYCVK